MDNLRNHANHVLVWQESQQPASEAVEPWSVIRSREVNQHGSGLLFCQEPIVYIRVSQPGIRRSILGLRDGHSDFGVALLYCDAQFILC